MLKIEMHKERGKYGIYKSRGVSKCLLSVLTNVPTIYIFRQILNTERGGGRKVWQRRQYIFFDKYLTRKGGGVGGKESIAKTTIYSLSLCISSFTIWSMWIKSLSDKIAPEKNNLQQNICRFWRRPPVHVFKTGTNQPNHHPPWITL